MKHDKLTASSLLKYASAFSAFILLLCAILLIFTDNSVQNSPEKISYQTAGNMPASADFYQANYSDSNSKPPETAFLLAANQDGTAEKALLSLLLQSGAPVLLTHHTIGETDELLTLEAEAAILTSKTGLHDSDIILIGLQNGGTALLDEIINGSRSYKAMALVTPILGENKIDEGKIVGGNYYNENNWINSLDTSMVRQPTLLLSSNGDDITTPYDMTLLYNKLSGDQIIHMGGVYRASQNNLTLSVLDGGFHPTSSYNKTLLSDLLSFLSNQSGLTISYNNIIFIKNILQVFLVISLAVLVFCISRLTRYRLTDVSYGVKSSIKVDAPIKFFLIKILSWLLTIPIAWLLIWSISKLEKIPLSAGIIFAVILFSESVLSFFATKLMKQEEASFFQPIAIRPLKLFLSIIYAISAFGILMILPFSGYTFSLPDSRTLLILAGFSLLCVLWFRLYLGESEQIEDYKSGYTVKIIYYLIAILPLIFFTLLYAIFNGNTAALSCLIILALLLANMLLAKGIFHLSGSAFTAALIASFSFQSTAFILGNF